MGTPITWRNVSSDTPAAVPALLQGAGNSINNSFDIFGGLIANREQVNANNVKALDEAAKQNYLDQVAGLKTPEAVKAAEASLTAARAGLSPQAQAAVRGADEARLASVRQGITADQTFGAQQLALKNAPQIDRINSLIQQGDMLGAFAETNASDLPNKAALFAQIKSADRNNVLQGREDWKAANLVEDRNRMVNVTRPREDAAAQLTLDAAQQAAQDAAEARRLETRLATLGQTNAIAVDGVVAAQGKLATQLRLPTVAGKPDFANMDTLQRALFDHEATKAGVPPSTSTTEGDTAKGDQAYQGLLKSGEFSPRILRANEGAIRSIYNTAPKPVVGNDAFNLNLSTAQNDVAFDRIDASNWYAPGSPDARKAYEDLATKLPDIVKNSPTGYFNERSVPEIQDYLNEIAVRGVKRGDGKYVIPSVNDILGVVRASEDPLFGTRLGDIKSKLEKLVDTPEAIKMQQEGIQSQQYRDKQRVIQKLREAGNPPAK